jgi:hypothetical protein
MSLKREIWTNFLDLEVPILAYKCISQIYMYI